MPETTLSQCVEGRHDPCPEQIEFMGLVWTCSCGCHPEKENEDFQEWEYFEYDRDRGFHE